MKPLDDFQTLFGRSPTATAAAAGRVNLMGEHTDYNGGLVLPTAIPQRTIVELTPRTDRLVRIASADVPRITKDAPLAEYHLEDAAPRRDWLAYIQGCTVELERAGHFIRGFEARVTSTVPIGAGLSSSAALEVGLLRALRSAFGLRLDDVALALVGHRAEHDFVGARVGVMDQMAASVATWGSALFLDTRSLVWEHVPLPADGELVVIDSGIAHAHATGGYNVRRSECEEACRLLGVAQLRDLEGERDGSVENLPEPLRRRVRHVLSENDRVRAAVRALHDGDLAELGHLFFASHASMRDDYDVSIPAIDALVDLARADDDVLGARLTGGGFGGAVVLLTRSGTATMVGPRLATQYQERTGHRATILVPPDTERPAE